jgi:hypothetical protein
MMLNRILASKTSKLPADVRETIETAAKPDQVENGVPKRHMCVNRVADHEKHIPASKSRIIDMQMN